MFTPASCGFRASITRRFYVKIALKKGWLLVTTVQ